MKIFGGVLLLLLIILAYKSRQDEKRSLQKLRNDLGLKYGSRNKKEYEPGELQRIKASSERILGESKVDKGDQPVDDITWHDLDMDDVFGVIDSCDSRAGEERLYGWLRVIPGDRKELEYRDEIISHFDEEPESRLEYEMKLSALTVKSDLTPGKAVEALKEIRQESNAGHILMALSACASFILIFIYPSAGLICFLAVLSLNIVTYFRRKTEISGQLDSITYILKAIRVSKDMLKVNDDDDLRYRRVLKSATDLLYDLSKWSVLLVGGRGLTGGIMNMILDYVRMIFHLDLMVFNSIQSRIAANRDTIRGMFDALGDIDAAIAVASFRRYKKVYCKPGFSEEKGSISVKGLYHVLLEDPVCYDIETYGGVLVTGSNASGKSTFLRSMAIAVLMGQTVCTVCAEAYEAPWLRLYSSMSIRDDILKGDSYYMAEVKSIKRIVDAAKSDTPMICFLDEVLRGTNTVERIAASSQILKEIVNSGAFCFAATHDIELTEILSDCYENYHFEEEIRRDDISFSYKLHKGPAVSKNAIKLLGIMGYDPEIIERAEKMAEGLSK